MSHEKGSLGFLTWLFLIVLGNTLTHRRIELAKMFVAKAYSIEYLAFQDSTDGEFSDEIVAPKPQNV